MGGTANNGGPAPETRCDGNAVSVRCCWGLQGFDWFNCLAPHFSVKGEACTK